jgi:hypothetical protein
MKQGIDRDVLALLLLSLSKVDSTVVYEYETLCQYNDINRFRQDDYIVISYSKSHGGYKTIFNVPFSRKKALRRQCVQGGPIIRRAGLRAGVETPGHRS